MSRAGWVAKGILRLVFVVLLSLLLAGLGYLAIIAVITSFPPHAIQ
ncbi:hypothetical protein [Dyella japonica]|nr:hypothetical protein [Dyella japonica]